MRGGDAPAWLVPCALAVRRAGAEPCGGVAGGRGRGSAAGRDLLWLLSSSLFGSVDEIDDHSMLRRRAAEGGRGVASGDSGVRTAGPRPRAGRAGESILSPLAEGRPESEPVAGARAARHPSGAARSSPIPRRPRPAGSGRSEPALSPASRVGGGLVHGDGSIKPCARLAFSWRGLGPLRGARYRCGAPLGGADTLKM